MKRAEAKTQTFNQILKRLETQNAECLIEKARTANRLAKSAPDSRAGTHGWVAEWFKAPVLKTGVGASPPWVRIPPHPPAAI